MLNIQRLSLVLIILSICLVLSAADTSLKASTTSTNDPNEILAEFDGGVIQRKDIDLKISKLPPAYQARYRTVDGQLEVLNITAAEEAFYAKALQMKLDKDKDVVEKIHSAEKRFLIQEYYKRNVSDLLVMTDADKLSYYNQNIQTFYVHPYLTIQYIQVANEEEGRKALAELNSGATLEAVSEKYNQNTYAKGLKGIVKNVRLNGNIPGVGNDLQLEELIRNSEVNSVGFTGPVRTETGWHIFRTIESIPGRQKDYSEVIPEIEQRYRPSKERSMLDALIDNLKVKYNVTVNADIIDQIDIKDRDKNLLIMDEFVMNSPNEQLRITVRQLLETYDRIPPQEQIFITKGGGAQQLAEQELMQNIIFVEAKAANYSQYLTGNTDLNAMKRAIILRKIFEMMVVDAVTVSDEEILERYNKDISQYTNPAHRAIEVLYFDSKKEADRAWKKYNQAYKKKNEKKMQAVITKYSKNPQGSVLDHQYDNGIVTSIGPDKDFSKKIWSNPVGYLSPVFTSAKGEIVFFRTLRETPASYRPLSDFTERIRALVKKDKEKTKQEEVTEQLFVEVNMRKYPERISSLLSADELFTHADDAARQRNFKDAISFYDQIIKSFKNGSDDYKASFMKAFLIAEELKNTDQALQLFREFLVKYPKGDLNDSAKFMIQSLEGNVPDVIEAIQD